MTDGSVRFVVLVLVLVVVYHRKIRPTQLWVELSWVVAIYKSNACELVHYSMSSLPYLWSVDNSLNFSETLSI